MCPAVFSTRKRSAAASTHAASSASNASRLFPRGGVARAQSAARSRSVAARCGSTNSGATSSAAHSTSTPRVAASAARRVSWPTAASDETLAAARAARAERRHADACGATRKTCATSLHATYAKALAAVIPVISSASAHVRTSSGFAEKSFWKTSELRASDSPLGAPASPRRPALLSFALLFLFSRRLAFAGACGGVSGPLSAWTTSAMDSPNARITELCPWPAWWPLRRLCALSARARAAHTAAASSARWATPARNAANAPESPALEMCVASWHRHHATVSLTVSL